MNFYRIKQDYILFLKKYDDKVADNKNENRPYIGIVLEIENIKYYAPFTSPKAKHLKMKNAKDFRKINNGKYGAINFNNMIPVPESALIRLDFNSEPDEKYRRLLQNQYKWINKDSDVIKRTAFNLRELLIKEPSLLTEYDISVKKRCCDLKLLESVYTEYKPYDIEIFKYDEVTSTNDLAKEYAAENPGRDAVFIAESQTKGRGRRGRSFFSPKGSGIYMSFLVHPKSDNAQTSVLTCMTAVAVCRAIEEACGISAQIKWVNDIYYNERKICGILTEGQIDPETGSYSHMIIGAGLNIYSPDGGFPEDIQKKAGALMQGCKDGGIKEKLCMSMISNFFDMYNDSEGVSFLDEYRSRSMLTGKYVKIADHGSGYVSEEKQSALVIGIDDECRLVVKFNDGAEGALSSGEVSVLPNN